MTREEALKQIEELKKFIDEQEVGFEDDEIFLLSVDGYKEYQKLIPQFNCWWWLRSPGCLSIGTANVHSNGSVYCDGDYVAYESDCVRPALRLETGNHKIGDRIVKYDFPWIVIDECLAIAEVPIATHRFDAESNNYGKSEIRQFLLDWVKERRSSTEN